MAGSSCATALAKLLIYRGLKTNSGRYPAVKLANIVDVTLQVIGPRATAVKQAAGATADMMQLFKAKRLPMSMKKTFFLASSEAVVVEFVAGGPPRPGTERGAGKNVGN